MTDCFSEISVLQKLGKEGAGFTFPSGVALKVAQVFSFLIFSLARVTRIIRLEGSVYLVSAKS